MLIRIFAICLFIAVLAAFIAGREKESPTVFTIATEATNLDEHEHELAIDSIGDTGHHVDTYSPTVTAPYDMWVRSISFEIEIAPAITLHHATLFRIDRFDRECSEEQGERLISFSQDQMHNPIAQFPEGYGIFIPKDTPLQLHAMFHNPEPPLGPGGKFDDVRVIIELQLADQKEAGLKPLSFHLLRLSDTPCATESRDAAHVFVVPPLTSDYLFTGTDSPRDTARFVATVPLKLVYSGAHIHGWESGKELTVRKNGEALQTFVTTKAAGDPYRYDTPHSPTDVNLMPGDIISIEAVYDNPNDEAIRDAMGEFGMYVTKQ